MIRIPFPARAIATILMGWALCGSGFADPQKLSLDDVLKVADIGAVTTDPNGRWLIFEQQRPYDQNRDFSFRTYAMGKSGHQLWMADLSGNEPPRRLPGLDPDKHSYLDSFSPDGTYLAVMQYSRGVLTLGSYDLEQSRYIPFERVPAFSRTGAHNPVWVGPDRLVYSALAPGDLPEETSVRVMAADQFTSAAEAAWRGDTVTAIEVPRADAYEGALMLADARTGASEVLAQGLYADLRLSPDGTMLAALKVEPKLQHEGNTETFSGTPHHRLVVFDMNTRRPVYTARALDTYPYTVTWSGDSTHVAAFSWQDGAGPETGLFHVLDLQRNVITPFRHNGLDLVSERERGWLQRPERVHFLGRNLLVFARARVSGANSGPAFTPKDTRPERLGRADWYAISPEGNSRNLTAGLQNLSPIPVDGGPDSLTVLSDEGVISLKADGTRQIVYQARSHRPHLLRPGTFATRASVARPAFTRRAALEVNEEAGRQVVYLAFDENGRAARKTVPLPEEYGTLVGADPVSSAAFLRKEVAGVVTFAVAGESGKVREIVTLNRHMADRQLGSWQELSYRIEAGDENSETLTSCLLLPADFDPARPPPLIVDVYPNVSSPCPEVPRGLAFPDPASPYVWAGKGYAYIRPATPRSLIRMKDGPLAGLPSVLAAAISEADSRGFIDADKVVLHGFSQGAVSALYVAAKPGTYRAVIARNGWADLFSHYFGPAGAYAYTGGRFGEFGRYDRAVGSDFNFGRTPFDDPEAYFRNSPVFLANRIDASVLLVHSDLDSFSEHQFDEMYGALLRAGKKVRYVRYLGEGHGPSSPANIRDLWHRMELFLSEAGASP